MSKTAERGWSRTMTLREGMIDWLADISFADVNPDEQEAFLQRKSFKELANAVEAHYDGGFIAFVRDGSDG